MLSGKPLQCEDSFLCCMDGIFALEVSPVLKWHGLSIVLDLICFQRIKMLLLQWYVEWPLICLMNGITIHAHITTRFDNAQQCRQLEHVLKYRSKRRENKVLYSNHMNSLPIYIKFQMTYGILIFNQSKQTVNGLENLIIFLIILPKFKNAMTFRLYNEIQIFVVPYCPAAFNI